MKLARYILIFCAIVIAFSLLEGYADYVDAVESSPALNAHNHQ